MTHDEIISGNTYMLMALCRRVGELEHKSRDDAIVCTMIINKWLNEIRELIE